MSYLLKSPVCVMNLKLINICILFLALCFILYITSNKSTRSPTSTIRLKKFKHKHRTRSKLKLKRTEVKPVADNSKAGSPEDLRNLFKERRLSMLKACKEGRESNRIPLEVSKPDFQFNVAPQEQLIMCKTAKHGSTTLSQYFVQILTEG